MRRGQVNPRSWDAAIRAVQKELHELAAATPLTDEQDRTFQAVFERCEELTAKRYLAWFSTNRELARKYRISPRTVTNWRREGCPFLGGQARVLGWVARRRYAPAGTREKFAGQLRRRKPRMRNLLALMRDWVLAMRAAYREHGIPMDDHLRRMPFRAR